MKKKQKALSLKKVSIVDLKSQELNSVKGGTGFLWCTVYPYCPPSDCDKTFYIDE